MTLGLAAAAIGFPAAAAGSEAEESKKMLEWLRSLRHDGDVPALTGFSPAKPIADFTAPPGGHDLSQAYKSAAGCVAFFAAPADHFSGVAFKVKGLPCNGKPLEGKGELQIYRKHLNGAGFDQVISVLSGEFSKGMLTGEAAKANFTFNAAGKPVADTYVFSGRFENSVLNGKGQRRWTGPKDGEPSAIALEGNFKDGVPSGGVLQSRLHPLPGVEADFQPLHYSPKGNSYVEQSQLNGGKTVDGYLFLYQDPARWKVEVATWRDHVEAGALTRKRDDEENFYAACKQWDFAAGKISCMDGNVGGGFKGTYYGVERGPFSIPLPFDTRSVPFRVNNQQKVTIGLEMQNQPGVSCNPDMTRCSGMVVTALFGSSQYLRGDAEVRDGAVYFKSAKLYQRASGLAYSPEYNYSSDKVEASCSNFSSPLVCAKGVYHYSSGTTATGSWKFKNVGFETLSERGRIGYITKGEFGPVMNGNVRMDYANGSWADVVMVDSEIESVEDCGVPDGASVSCAAEGSTMTFTRRGSSRPQAERVEPRRVQSFEAPERYKPIVMPTRPVYVLPGMR